MTVNSSGKALIRPTRLGGVSEKYLWFYAVEIDSTANELSPRPRIFCSFIMKRIELTGIYEVEGEVDEKHPTKRFIIRRFKFHDKKKTLFEYVSEQMLLGNFIGVGYDIADRVLNVLGDSILVADESVLMQVDGIGKKKAKSLRLSIEECKRKWVSLTIS